MVLQVIAKIDGKHRRAPEIRSVLVVGNEVFCYYFLYGVKVHKSSVSEKIKQYERDLVFQKTQIFIFFKQIS